MSKTKRYSYVGAILSIYRSDFPLICGCCGKDVPTDIANVYFDNGPGDFFIVDRTCAEKVEGADAATVRTY
jgi:hypothetical protein